MKAKPTKHLATLPLIWGLKVYKLTISPLLGNHCRFYPSCSEYCSESLRVHGLIAGLILSFKRISKCHPLHEGGIDPIPPVNLKYSK